jgi:phosphate-selective porin
MTRHLLARFSAVAILLGAASVTSNAKTVTTDDLSAVVKDASSAVVPSASKTLKSSDTGETRMGGNWQWADAWRSQA